MRKKNRPVYFLLSLAFWGLAIVVLTMRCGTLFSGKCNSTGATQTAATVAQNAVSPGLLPQFPILDTAVALASLVDTNIFMITIYGLVVISGVIMVRAFKVSFGESHVQLDPVKIIQEGQEAVLDAIKVLDEEESGDPRTRIIACYQRMIKAAMKLGAPIGPDRTARELERSIREMFLLKGPGIARLTQLFEEARYSLHPVFEMDSRAARECLLEISEELHTASPTREEPNALSDLQA